MKCPGKIFLVLTLLLISSSFLFSQNGNESEVKTYPFKYKSIQLTQDFLFTFSINFEHLFPVKDKLKLGYRVGLGDDQGELSYEVIGGAVMLYGKRKHFLETGIAYQHPFYYREEGPDPPSFAFIAGYRYQSAKGFIFKIYPELLVEAYESEDSWGPFPFLGFSFGYAF